MAKLLAIWILTSVLFSVSVDSGSQSGVQTSHENMRTTDDNTGFMEDLKISDFFEDVGIQTSASNPEQSIITPPDSLKFYRHPSIEETDYFDLSAAADESHSMMVPLERDPGNGFMPGNPLGGFLHKSDSMTAESQGFLAPQKRQEDFDPNEFMDYKDIDPDESSEEVYMHPPSVSPSLFKQVPTEPVPKASNVSPLGRGRRNKQRQESRNKQHYDAAPQEDQSPKQTCKIVKKEGMQCEVCNDGDGGYSEHCSHSIHSGKDRKYSNSKKNSHKDVVSPKSGAFTANLPVKQNQGHYGAGQRQASHKASHKSPPSLHHLAQQYANHGSEYKNDHSGSDSHDDGQEHVDYSEAPVHHHNAHDNYGTPIVHYRPPATHYQAPPPLRNVHHASQGLHAINYPQNRNHPGKATRHNVYIQQTPQMETVHYPPQPYHSNPNYSPHHQRQQHYVERNHRQSVPLSSNEPTHYEQAQHPYSYEQNHAQSRVDTSPSPEKEVSEFIKGNSHSQGTQYDPYKFEPMDYFNEVELEYDPEDDPKKSAKKGEGQTDQSENHELTFKPLDPDENFKFVGKMVTQFAAKDRANCTAVEKNGMLCYKCPNEHGQEDEECVYAKDDKEGQHIMYTEETSY